MHPDIPLGQPLGDGPRLVRVVSLNKGPRLVRVVSLNKVKAVLSHICDNGPLSVGHRAKYTAIYTCRLAYL